MEIWKEIKGFENYQISNLGNVKSLNYKKTGNQVVLKKELTRKGYYRVVLTNNRLKKRFLCHVLTAIAFIQNPENKPQVNHKNGIKNDNRIENLEWNTESENMKHAFETGLKTSKTGESHVLSKLTELQVLEIRKIGKTLFQQEIAKIYKVDRTLIGKILNRTTWKHI